VRRAGASGELTLRTDSGFWSAKTIKTCRRHQLHYSITVRQTTPIRQAIATIDEAAWTDIVYPDGGLAQVAETRYKGRPADRAPHPPVGAQAELCIRDLKAGVGLRHCPRASSPPTPPGWWWPRRCAAPCWPYPVGSPAQRTTPDPSRVSVSVPGRRPASRLQLTIASDQPTRPPMRASARRQASSDRPSPTPARHEFRLGGFRLGTLLAADPGR
jgi:hypothetical protein